MIAGKPIEGIETVRAIPNMLDDFEEQYEEYGSIGEAMNPNVHVQFVPDSRKEAEEIMKQKEQFMFDLKNDAQQIVDSHKEYQAEVSYQKTKEEWSHVESQPEEVQKAIVDNINIKLVFEVMKRKHSRLDSTEHKLQEGKTPSMEEQHAKVYDQLMNDMIKSLEYISEKKKIIDALD